MSGRTLATDVTVAATLWAQTRGWIGRTDIDCEEALVFTGLGGAQVPMHMLGVRTALDVLWLREGVVTAVDTLPAWYGLGLAPADTVVELAPGAAAPVAVGDRVIVEENTVLHARR